MSVTADEKTAGEQGGEDLGKQARKLASRSSQAVWKPGPDRVGPLEVLAEQDRTRVPELIPVRYGRMLASAFTFYRGAAAIMAADLAAEPRFRPPGAALRRRPPLQLRRLPGPRPTARLRHQRLRRDPAGAVRVGRQAAGRERRDRCPRPRLQRVRVRNRGARRRSAPTATAMARFATMGDLDVWYARIDVEDGRRAQWQSRRQKGATAAGSKRTSRRRATRTACGRLPS